MEYPDRKVYDYRKKTEPVAEQIVQVLLENEISYLECEEALEIAKDKLWSTYPRLSAEIKKEQADIAD